MQPLQAGPTKAIEARFQRGPTRTITAVHPYIARRPVGSMGTFRWALFRPDGTLQQSFAPSLDRFDAATLLAAGGFVRGADDAVVPVVAPPVYEPVGRGGRSMNAVTHPASLDRAAISVTAPNPDADLIAACRDHAEAHAAFLVAVDDSPEETAYIASLRKITGVIPKTLAGSLAIADAIMLEAITEDGKFTVEGNVAADWCFQVVQALHAATRPHPDAPSSEER